MNYLPGLPSSPTSKCQYVPKQGLLQFQSHFASGPFAKSGRQPTETELNFGQCAHHLLLAGAWLAGGDIVAHDPCDSCVEEETRTCIDKVPSGVATLACARLDVAKLACLPLQQIEDVEKYIIDRHCFTDA